MGVGPSRHAAMKIVTSVSQKKNDNHSSSLYLVSASQYAGTTRSARSGLSQLNLLEHEAAESVLKVGRTQ